MLGAKDQKSEEPGDTLFPAPFIPLHARGYAIDFYIVRSGSVVVLEQGAEIALLVGYCQPEPDKSHMMIRRAGR